MVHFNAMKDKKEYKKRILDSILGRVNWLVQVPFWLKGRSGVAKRQLANNWQRVFSIWRILFDVTGI